ncbi:FAD-dependent oxidoreductase [Streptomyces decoyicus]|uniref:FAD-dependent oxidoreductase n=1 Tax=Streptomyces decoyicus TaxID=249567 RepID=UPI003633AB9E
MNTPEDVLVVGASAAGLAVVESLRRKGYRGRITLLGEETGTPYDRPPLSKQVLAGTWDAERTHLRTRDVLDALDAEFSSASARYPSMPPRAPCAHVLRTLDDAARLRGELLDAERVVVVGDGMLGAEVAATARQMDREVTLAGPQAAPMRTQLGHDIAERLAAELARTAKADGVTFRAVAADCAYGDQDRRGHPSATTPGALTKVDTTPGQSTYHLARNHPGQFSSSLQHPGPEPPPHPNSHQG